MSITFNPYSGMPVSEVASKSADGSLSFSSRTISTDENCDDCSSFAPTVVYRRKHFVATNPSIDAMGLLDQWRNGTIVTMRKHLAANKHELDALVHSMVISPSVLRYASFAQGGLLISTVLKLIDDIRQKILLEVLASNTELVWELATNTIALQNIYNLADRQWRCQLHQLLIPRFSELCCHPQGNYMASHMLRAYPAHQDVNFMSAITAIFSDGAQLPVLGQDRAAVCVMVVWASVIPAAHAYKSVQSLLCHPKATFVFYRLAMSGIAYKIVASLLRQLTKHKDHLPLITTVLSHIRGSRFAGKIRGVVGAR